MKKILLLFLILPLLLTAQIGIEDYEYFLRLPASGVGGGLQPDGSIPLTADWPMGVFNLTQAGWHGQTIAADHGGTGQSSYTIGDILHATSSSAVGKLADVAVGQVLASGGVGAIPAYTATPTLTSLSVPVSTAAAPQFNLSNNTDTGLYMTATAMGYAYDGSSKFSVNSAGRADLTGVYLATGLTLSGDYIDGSAGQLLFNSSKTYNSAKNTNVFGYLSTFNNTTGESSEVKIIPTYNQAALSTSSNLDVIVDRTETSVGSGTQRFFSGQVGSIEKWGVDNRGGMMAGLTPDVIMQVGMIAMADAGTDERYDVNGAAGTLPIGVVGGSSPTVVGTARGLAVQGTCYVAPAEDVVTITRRHVCFVDASDAGYVDDNAALQAAGLNVGIYINSEAAIAFDGEVDVDPAANTIVLDSTPAWVVGDPVVFWDSADTAPTGMTTGNVYWIKTIATATVTLSATRGGATLDITGDGSGTTMYLMRLPKVLLNWR